MDSTFKLLYYLNFETSVTINCANRYSNFSPITRQTTSSLVTLSHTHFITVLPCDIFVSHVILIVLSKLTISFANEIENDVNDTIIINIKNVRNCKFIENVSLRIRILKNHSLIYLVTKIYVF